MKNEEAKILQKAIVNYFSRTIISQIYSKGLGPSWRENTCISLFKKNKWENIILCVVSELAEGVAYLLKVYNFYNFIGSITPVEQEKQSRMSLRSKGSRVVSSINFFYQ